MTSAAPVYHARASSQDNPQSGGGVGRRKQRRTYNHGGTGTWRCTSDREKSTAFAESDPFAVLLLEIQFPRLLPECKY
jgi:hypothetical protein